MVAAQYEGGHISTYATIAMFVETIISTSEVVLFRISTGRVGEDIIDYVSTGARKRVEHEGAQARRHDAHIEGHGDVCGRGAGSDAGVIGVKENGDFGSTTRTN